MNRILIYWGYYADLISCPAYIAEHLKKYQRRFDKWLVEDGHELNSKDSEDNDALSFTGEDFLEWLNKFEIKKSDEKAYFIKTDFVPTAEELKLPRIYL